MRPHLPSLFADELPVFLPGLPAQPAAAPSTPPAPPTPSPAAPFAERLAAALPAGLWRAAEAGPVAAPGSGLSTGHAALDAELPGGGWPQGQLVELLLDAPGLGELGLVLPALARVAQAGRPSVWVLPHDARPAAGEAGPMRHFPAGARPYAPALADAGIDLGRCVFVQPASPREALWTFEQSLRAPHLGAVIGWLPDTASADAAFRALRRLQLLAQRHQALLFVLRPVRAAAAPSPAVLRLQLSAENGQLGVRLLKRRGRPLLDPVWIQVPTQPAGRRPAVAPGRIAAGAATRAPARSMADLADLAGRFAGLGLRLGRLLPGKAAALLEVPAAPLPAFAPLDAGCAS